MKQNYENQNHKFLYKTGYCRTQISKDTLFYLLYRKSLPVRLVLDSIAPRHVKKTGPRHWEFLLFSMYWSTYLVTKLLYSWIKLLGNCSIWMLSDKCGNMVNSNPVQDWTPHFPYLTYKNTQLYNHTSAILPSLCSDMVVTRNKQQPITQIDTRLLCEEQKNRINMCQNLQKRLKEMQNLFWRWSQMIRCGFTQDGIQGRRFNYTTTIREKNGWRTCPVPNNELHKMF